jgi:nucleoside-diphosphate-sugar epimerase
MARVFLTGNRGFFGRVLEQVLVGDGHDVVGCDVGFFDGPGSESWDVRDVVVSDLRGFDVVVHLAALCNDACGALSEAATVEINEHATARLAWTAREAGVPRFIFASSCSVYGAAGGDEIDETASPSPLTIYARAKLRAEAAIQEFATDRFSPVSLRFATLYGTSPSFRSDLLVNRMASTAMRFGWTLVNGDGSIVRPLLHVEDAGRAVATVTTADAALVHGEVFNVGTAGQNMRIAEVADLVRARFPHIVSRRMKLSDTRSYAVRFDRFAERFGDWAPRVGVAAGLDEVVSAFGDGKHAEGTPYGHTAISDGGSWGPTDRCEWLSGLLSQGRLSPSFRWCPPPAALQLRAAAEGTPRAGSQPFLIGAVPERAYHLGAHAFPTGGR